MEKGDQLRQTLTGITEGCTYYIYIYIQQCYVISTTLFFLRDLDNTNARLICREFGPKVINPKPLMKQMHTILEDRDKNVREEGKKLMVELYRWIGQALKPQMSSLKPVQVSLVGLCPVAVYSSHQTAKLSQSTVEF